MFVFPYKNLPRNLQCAFLNYPPIVSGTLKANVQRKENPEMTDTQILPATSLYFREGGSDKEYHARIEAKNDGFVVNFAYGKRGAALTIGTKTSTPTTLEAATKIFDKLVTEKKAKGYTPSTEGKAFAMTEKAGEVSGLLPQLLNPIEEDEVAPYLCDDRLGHGRKARWASPDGAGKGGNRGRSKPQRAAGVAAERDRRGSERWRKLCAGRRTHRREIICVRCPCLCRSKI